MKCNDEIHSNQQNVCFLCDKMISLTYQIDDLCCQNQDIVMIMILFVWIVEKYLNIDILKNVLGLAPIRFSISWVITRKAFHPSNRWIYVQLALDIKRTIKLTEAFCTPQYSQMFSGFVSSVYIYHMHISWYMINEKLFYSLKHS